MTHFKSKKFVALVVGASLTSLFTLSGLVGIVLAPQHSTSIVNLMTVALASVNSVIGVYALGQSAVDVKINSNRTTKQENKTSFLSTDELVEYEEDLSADR
jgi:hypothetical protein